MEHTCSQAQSNCAAKPHRMDCWAKAEQMANDRLSLADGATFIGSAKAIVQGWSILQLSLGKASIRLEPHRRSFWALKHDATLEAASPSWVAALARKMQQEQEGTKMLGGIAQ